MAGRGCTLACMGLRKVNRAKWAVFGLLVLVLLYRLLVVGPVGVDVYLLYLPGFVFSPFLLLLFVLCRRFSRQDLALLVSSVLIFFVWLQPLRWNRQAEGEVWIVSANIRAYETDLRKASSALEEINPDFLCLQEVWTRDQLNEISQALPGYQFFGNSEDDQVETHFRSGTFVAAARGWDCIRLDSADHASTVLARQGERKVLVSSFHGLKEFKYDPTTMLSTAELQREQASALRERLDDYPGMPAVVGGDFNAPLSGPARKVLDLSDAFSSSGNGFGLTFPAKYPILGLDRVLGRGLQFKSFQTLNVGSDHLAVVVSFDFSD